MKGRRTFIVLFVGFILTATGVSACPIELSPPSVVVKYGDPVSINCSTWDSNVTGMGWEASQGGTDVQEVQHLTWTVDSLTDWDTAPSCFINLENSSVEQCEKKPTVVVYTFPESIRITSSDLREGALVFREHEETGVSCDITEVAPLQNLTVNWYKDGKLIPTETYGMSSNEPFGLSYPFWHSGTRLENNSTLRCEAHMDLRPEGPELRVSSEEHRIEVHFGPEVHCSETVLLEGESLGSKCRVEGYPTPTVEWQKDGQTVDPSAPLSRGQSGDYYVVADGLRYVIPVVVMSQPELTCPSIYTTVEHAPNGISCTVKGYPEPQVTWLKDGEEVTLPETLTSSDAGRYVIIASNRVSSVNVTLDVFVNYPPSQIAELEDAEVGLGADVSLKCSSVGNPRPTYLWSYFRTTNVQEQSEDGVSLLSIRNATAYNRGSYTCHASNEVGKVSKTVTLTVRGAADVCPIKISPDGMVIPYQGPSQLVECSMVPHDPRNTYKISWEDASDRAVGETWLVNTSQDWDLRPTCTIKVAGFETCQKTLNYTLYKMPDSVFVSADGSSVVEGRSFQLRCLIVNVAPARSLVVRWYRGNDIFEPRVEGSLEIPDCPFESNASCDVSAIRSPVNVSSTIDVVLNREHRSVQFRCDVELNLGPNGPDPPPNMTSSPLTITVLSKPIINATKLPKTVPVFRGYPEELVCEADGHPPPRIQWSYRSTTVSNSTFTAVEAGLYNCTATNEVDSSFYVVEVVLKEDYLPLIAGFVAVTVVAISVVFLFIYSIYYKNTKMRRYSFKNPKLGNHNGNVAHNGWDLQLPMTKLS